MQVTILLALQEGTCFEKEKMKSLTLQKYDFCSINPVYWISCDADTFISAKSIL